MFQRFVIVRLGSVVPTIWHSVFSLFNLHPLWGRFQRLRTGCSRHLTFAGAYSIPVAGRPTAAALPCVATRAFIVVRAQLLGDSGVATSSPILDVLVLSLDEPVDILDPLALKSLVGIIATQAVERSRFHSGPVRNIKLRCLHGYHYVPHRHCCVVRRSDCVSRWRLPTDLWSRGNHSRFKMNLLAFTMLMPCSMFCFRRLSDSIGSVFASVWVLLSCNF